MCTNILIYQLYIIHLQQYQSYLLPPFSFFCNLWCTNIIRLPLLKDIRIVNHGFIVILSLNTIRNYKFVVFTYLYLPRIVQTGTHASFETGSIFADGVLVGFCQIYFLPVRGVAVLEHLQVTPVTGCRLYSLFYNGFVTLLLVLDGVITIIIVAAFLNDLQN